MPDKTRTTKDIVGCDVLSLNKLKTSEGDGDQKALATLVRADEHAVDLIVSGPLLPTDAGPVRLSEAIEDISGITRCGCKNCEEANYDAMRREEATYYIGFAVGLRLAQVTAMRDKAIAREQLLHRVGLDGGAE